MIKADHHDGVGELGAVVGAVTSFAFHVIAASTESENVGAAVCVGFERLISLTGEGKKIENIALTAGDFSDNIITPENGPSDATDKNNNNDKGDNASNAATFGGFFLGFLGFLGFSFFHRLFFWFF